MRIALISYEYPPEIGKGGIATYTEQLASNLTERGHDVEVFCGSHTRSGSEENGFKVHRILTENPVHFRTAVVDKFSERQEVEAFDVMESPEINANAIEIKKKFPGIPLLVKLHTPSFIIVHLNHNYVSFLKRLRFFLGGLRRGLFQFYSSYRNMQQDIDYQMTMHADLIVSPSKSLKNIIVSKWKIAPTCIDVIPNIFTPSPNLLNYPINKNSSKTILFIGKLNEHKGIVNLVKAIPAVIQRDPEVKFKFIGADGRSSIINDNMSVYIKAQLKGYESNCELAGPLPYEFIAQELGKTEICIFPSIWENFPYVCLEAMSAGCAVIGSKEGGMAEMLINDAGILINPNSVNDIVNAINFLVKHEFERHEFGKTARQKVLSEYISEKIVPAIEKSYLNAIKNCQN